jgi:hypothetical protein
MGSLASVGDRDVGGRGGRDLLHRRPERVFVLAVLAIITEDQNSHLIAIYGGLTNPVDAGDTPKDFPQLHQILGIKVKLERAA